MTALAPWRGAPDGDAAALARGGRWIAAGGIAFLALLIAGPFLVFRMGGEPVWGAVAAMDMVWTTLAAWGLWLAAQPGPGRPRPLSARRALWWLAALPVLALPLPWIDPAIWLPQATATKAFWMDMSSLPGLLARIFSWLPPLFVLGRHARSLARADSEPARFAQLISRYAVGGTLGAAFWLACVYTAFMNVTEFAAALAGLMFFAPWVVLPGAVVVRGLRRFGARRMGALMVGGAPPGWSAEMLPAPPALVVEAAPTRQWHHPERPDRPITARAMTELAPPGLELTVWVQGLEIWLPGLRIAARGEDDPGGDEPEVLRTGDPILDRLLRITAHPAQHGRAARLVAGLHAPLLAALHAHPASTLDGGWLRLRVIDGALPDATFAALIELLDALETRCDQDPAGGL